jgi:hypothetical protein
MCGIATRINFPPAQTGGLEIPVGNDGCCLAGPRSQESYKANPAGQFRQSHFLPLRCSHVVFKLPNATG